jgi:glycosyltransferase involved in cell wall biosynthesis
MKKPIVHAYFLCYNEANILPHLLRHYLSFCEKVTIIDNNSTDNSVEIVNSFPNTQILEYNSNKELRDDIYIQIKNNVWKNSKNIADYVIVGDADEFLYHEDIISFLTKAYNDNVTIFKPEGYHMVGDEDLILNFDDNIFDKVKEGVKTNVLDKMMIFNCNQINEINYSFGCHAANPVGNIKLISDNSLKMLHYKFMGLKDHMYKQKIRGERLSDFNKKLGLGTYYLFTEEQQINDYRSYLEKRKKVIS